MTRKSRLKALFDFLVPRLCYWPYVLRFRLKGRRSRKLNVGCGKNRLADWINADLTLGVDLMVFLEKRLPLPDNSLDHIYSEHVIEHVPYETAVHFLRESYRVLRPGGVMRIATPDLDDLIDGYLHDWRRFDWVNWPGHEFIKTRAQMINMGFRYWGHQHLYNREELERALRDAGFTVIEFAMHGDSRHAALRGLETRVESNLIAESVKP